MDSTLHLLTRASATIVAACCVLGAALPASANPIVLKANTVPDKSAVIRPLLPPDTLVVDSGKDVQHRAPPIKPKPSQVSLPEPQQKPKQRDSKQLAITQPSEPKPISKVAPVSPPLGIDVSHNPGVDTIALRVHATNPKYSIERLDNPPRLVVDIESVTAGTSRAIATKQLDLVSNVRVGAHPNRSRVVLDLKKSDNVAHDATVVADSILLTLRVSAPKSPSVHEEASRDVGHEKHEDVDLNTSVPLEDSGADEALETSGAQVDEEPVVDIDRDKGLQLAQAENPQIERVVATQDLKGATDARIEVASVSLEKRDSTSPEVKIKVSGKPTYQLQRTAPSEYVLSILHANLSKSVTKEPIISGTMTTAIRSVRSTAIDSKVLVRIFAQPSSYLTAREENGSIVVAETQDLQQVVKDIRAQLAPPGKEAKAEAEPTKVPVPEVIEVQPPAAPNLPKDSQDKAKEKSSQKAAGPKSEASRTTESRAKGAKTVTEITDADIDALLGDKAKYNGRLISLDLQETDIDNALRIIAEVSNLNIVASEDVKGKVTLRLLDVPWDQALDVILKTNGLDKVLEGSVMRIAPVEKLKVERENLKQAKDAEEELEPLSVKYLRVSYAKAAEIKSLVETVLSERGSVAYDERSNQLIVKDVRAGLRNVVELVSKVDLRTPQVLLETQIVEATRNLTRELGSELGFQYIQSPSTGNGTGLNFPSAISVGGSVANDSILGSAFPAATSLVDGSAVSMLFDSADGTKSLELRLSQLEQEGRVRIISRPAVATTNNKAAEIKSVEKFRVKLPNGGLSVATGAGASASGTGSTATEVIEAGITLNVIPQASPDYFILLDIKARSSTFGNKEVEGIPNEFERAASSTVLVSSGQTFALGGIYKVTEADRVSGVPFFKDIPVLGTFFRRTTTDDSDEELLFFITPRIVEGSFDDSSMKAMS